MSNPTPPPTPRFAPYRAALQSLSTRTRTPLPSLLLSFAILHELTAVAPLFAIFFSARQLGLGERVVSAVINSSEVEGGEGGGRDNVVKMKGREWVREGEAWAERVGRRYGVFGFEKRVRGGRDEEAVVSDVAFGGGERQGGAVSPKLAGDVANAIVAYGLTKALLPVRIGASLYFAPWFSRRLVEPLRTNIMRVFRRQSS